MHIYIYIYIYILNNLLNYSTYGKGKKPASNSKIKIYNESLSRGKNIQRKKKEKANLVTLIEKKSTDMQSIGQKKKPTVNCC